MKEAVLAVCFVLVYSFACYTVLKVEEISCSEVSVDFHRTRWRYIPEDRTLSFSYLRQLDYVTRPDAVWCLQDNSYRLFVCFVMKTSQICMSLIATLLTQVGNTCLSKEAWPLKCTSQVSLLILLVLIGLSVVEW
jgi:hypothetical protein